MIPTRMLARLSLPDLPDYAPPRGRSNAEFIWEDELRHRTVWSLRKDLGKSLGDLSLVEKAMRLPYDDHLSGRATAVFRFSRS